MSRLSALRPKWGRIYRDRDKTPDNSGYPTNEFELSFDCPTCAPGARVCIRVGPAMEPKTLTWHANPLPDGVDWPERVTIEPSINYTTAGHGRKRPPCRFHGTIVAGEIYLS